MSSIEKQLQLSKYQWEQLYSSMSIAVHIIETPAVPSAWANYIMLSGLSTWAFPSECDTDPEENLGQQGGPLEVSSTASCTKQKRNRSGCSGLLSVKFWITSRDRDSTASLRPLFQGFTILMEEREITPKRNFPCCSSCPVPLCVPLSWVNPPELAPSTTQLLTQHPCPHGMGGSGKCKTHGLRWEQFINWNKNNNSSNAKGDKKMKGRNKTQEVQVMRCPVHFQAVFYGSWWICHSFYTRHDFPW